MAERSCTGLQVRDACDSSRGLQAKRPLARRSNLSFLALTQKTCRHLRGRLDLASRLPLARVTVR